MLSVSITAITITVRMQANMRSSEKMSPTRDGIAMPSEAAKKLADQHADQARRRQAACGDDIGQQRWGKSTCDKGPISPPAERAHHIDQQRIDRAHAAQALKMKGNTERKKMITALPPTPTPKKITTRGDSRPGGSRKTRSSAGERGSRRVPGQP